MAGLIFAPGLSAWMVIVGAPDAVAGAQVLKIGEESEISLHDLKGVIAANYGIGWG